MSRCIPTADQDSSPPKNVTVLLLDLNNAEWADLAYANQQVLKFLRQVRPGDAIGIYRLSGGSLIVLHEVTRDSASLIKKLASDKFTSIPALASQDHLAGLSLVVCDGVAE